MPNVGGVAGKLLSAKLFKKRPLCKAQVSERCESLELARGRNTPYCSRQYTHTGFKQKEYAVRSRLEFLPLPAFTSVSNIPDANVLGSNGPYSLSS